jgi:hypothetical protein
MTLRKKPASIIGIKTADGKYYPVIEENSQAKKKLILTTAHDNQQCVQIELYRNNSKNTADFFYIGSLVIKGIKPRPKGEHSVELVITSTKDGEITANATDIDNFNKKKSRFLDVSLALQNEIKWKSVIPDSEFDNTIPPGLLVKPKENRAGSRIIIFAAVFLLVIGLILYFIKSGMKPQAAESPVTEEEILIEIPQPEDELELINPTVSVLNPVEVPDIILNYYRDEKFNDWVISFFKSLTGSQSIAETILSNASDLDISPSLAFALCAEESLYNPRAFNRNWNNTVDRGLFQLNSSTFPDVSVEEFYDIDQNTRHGLNYLRWCLNTAGNEVSALALYNAGPGNVSSAGTSKNTLDYISRILKRQRKIEELFFIEYITVTGTDELRTEDQIYGSD